MGVITGWAGLQLWAGSGGRSQWNAGVIEWAEPWEWAGRFDWAWLQVGRGHRMGSGRRVGVVNWDAANGRLRSVLVWPIKCGHGVGVVIGEGVALVGGVASP